MAFSGLHVVCSKAGGPGYKNDGIEILNNIAWSESPAANTITTNAANLDNIGKGGAVFHIYTSADSWVAIGANPDPSTNPRFLVKANEYFDVFVPMGSKLKWILA